MPRGQKGQNPSVENQPELETLQELNGDLHRRLQALQAKRYDVTKDQINAYLQNVLLGALELALKSKVYDVKPDSMQGPLPAFNPSVIPTILIQDFCISGERAALRNQPEALKFSAEDYPEIQDIFIGCISE